jgi:hypothetical protein
MPGNENAGVKTVGPANSWRLVHDGKNVIHLFESSGITHTINQLAEFPTKVEAEAEITKLGLIPLPVEAAEKDA